MVDPQRPIAAFPRISKDFRTDLKVVRHSAPQKKITSAIRNTETMTSYFVSKAPILEKRGALCPYSKILNPPSLISITEKQFRQVKG